MIHVSQPMTTVPEHFSTPLQALTYRTLAELSIPFQRVENDPAVTMEDCQAIDERLQMQTIKTLLLCNRQQTAFYLFVTPGDKPFRTKDLSKQIGSSRLSFAAPEDMEQYLGVTPGSATILSLMNDKEHRVKLILDKSIAEADRFGCHPCINTSTLNLSMPEMRDKFLPHLGIEPMLVDLPDVREETDA